MRKNRPEPDEYARRVLIRRSVSDPTEVGYFACGGPPDTTIQQRVLVAGARWVIETFHKVLKSGCRDEQSKLRTVTRLTNLLAVLCVVGWRVFWLTMTSRATPDAAPEVAFTPAEIAALDRMAGGRPEASQRTVSHYLVEVAKLGGYLARTKDPPPGNMFVWRGLTRLADILLGAELDTPSCG